MVKREIYGRYFIALVFTIVIFITGILVGSLMTGKKVTKIYESERELTTQFLVQDLRNTLLLSEPCKFVESKFVSGELFEIGRRLGALEREKGSSNPDVLSLKKYYTALELNDLLYFRQVNNRCGKKFILNLFFYSNNPERCGKCNDQGLVLAYARTKHENIRTYSFDVDLDSPLIEHLKELYGVTDVPSTVFNEKVYSGFLSDDEVERILKEI